MTPKDFISKYAADVVEACRGTKLFPSVKLAQMAIETGWGKAYQRITRLELKLKALNHHTGKVQFITLKLKRFLTGKL